MGKLAPTKVKDSPVKRVATKDHDCDRCGFSAIDGKRIAVAKYEVQVPGGSLYFCGYHLRKYFAHILERDYDVIPTGA